MSYFLWMLLSKGSRRYPTGLSWVLLSILRIVDYFAIIGVVVFLTVQTMGLAVDARSWLHYHAMQSEYNINANDETADADDEAEPKPDADFENFRLVEKQRAMFGWYGKALIFEESVYDKWRGLFDIDGLDLDSKGLTPFFWNFGSNRMDRSVHEIDFKYTILGVDGFKNGNDTSWGHGLTNLQNTYNLVNTNVSQKILSDESLSADLKQQYRSCAGASREKAVPFIMEMSTTKPLTKEDAKNALVRFKESKAKYKENMSCLVETQKDMGLKPYPSQEMLDYNDTVIDYRESLLVDINERLSETGVSEAFLVQNWDQEWMDKMNVLHNKEVCQIDINDQDCGYIEHFRNGNPDSSMLITTAFYDVVIKGNDAYKD